MNEAKTNVPDIIFSCEEGTMSLLCIKSHTINIMIREHKIRGIKRNAIN